MFTQWACPRIFAPERSLIINPYAMNLKLHSETQGDPNDPVIIILHGLFGSTSNWRTIGRSLSDSYYVNCLDLRNHGKSPWHDSMTYTEMADDVARFIMDHRLIKPNIIGHSMGGKTAMTLAQSDEVELGNIFIVDIAPVKYAHDHNDLVEAMNSISFDQVNSRKQVDNQLALTISEPAVRQFLMQNLNRDGDAYNWRINLNSIINNMIYIFDYKWNNIVICEEIIFISGDQSHYITSEYYSDIKRQFPNAIIESIEGAGHWLHAEKPSELLQIVNRHLGI